MQILLIGSRFHQGNPRRGVAVQTLGLRAALRRGGHCVELLDAFELQDGGPTEDALRARLAAEPALILAMGNLPGGWTGWETLADYQRCHGAPLLSIDTEDPVCDALADHRFTPHHGVAGAEFFPDAVDIGVYRPLRAERDFAFCFVGHGSEFRRQTLSLLRDLPSFVLDTGDEREPRVPQHAMASLLARSVIGLDLPGRRKRAVHGRVFEALATSTYALAPWSEALCACLEPGREVLVYRDSGEMIECLRQVNEDPSTLANVLIAGRKRVLEEHSFDQRADRILALVGESAKRKPQASPQPKVAAQPVEEPKVCVFMPVYNAEPFVGAAIDSILQQTHRNLQVVAVNDGSRDRSAEILRAKAARDARLQVLDFTDNRGEVVRRNDALAHIPSDAVYVTDHDADDLSDPTRLQKQVEYLEQNPQVHCVGSQVRLLDPQGDVVDVLRVAADPDEIDATLHKTNHMVNTATLFRRGILDRVIGYRQSYRSVDDYEFWARVLECGYRMANLPEVLVGLRKHDSSISSTFGRRQEELRLLVANRLQSSLPWRRAYRHGKALRLNVEVRGPTLASPGRLLVKGRDFTRAVDDDFRYLRMPVAACQELSLCHCLEQLSRAAGLRMLIEWHSWLEEDGRLLLQVVDFGALVEDATQGKLSTGELLRHVYGGQRDDAQAHQDAYDEQRLVDVLPRLGFGIEGMRQIEHAGVPTLLVEARKRHVAADEQGFAALDMLEDFLIDSSETELRDAWRRQLVGEPQIGNRADQDAAELLA